MAAIVTSTACLYRMDIVQGNRIDAEDIDQLRRGMTRSQVEFLLGTPAIVDNYHPDQWHYVYYLKPGDGEVESRLLTLQFEGDQLAEFSGDKKYLAEVAYPFVADVDPTTHGVHKTFSKFRPWFYRIKHGLFDAADAEGAGDVPTAGGN